MAMTLRVLLLLALPLVLTAISNISNKVPRVDADGSLMDAHDGNIVQWSPGGPYYWYGMGYRNCTESKGIIPPVDCPGIYKSFGDCGFRTDHLVNVYQSTDLVNWTLVGDALPIALRPAGIYFRPKVVRNLATGKYVLWINYLPPAATPLKAYPNATYLVATSESELGPFNVVTPRASVRNSGGGDFALFVDGADANQAAYIAYGAWSNRHKITVEKLTVDFLDSTGTGTEPITPSNNEAPMMFKRGGLYYLLWGPTCCFCHQGSGATVSIAQHPMGPWNNTGNDINPKKGMFESHIIAAQNNFVLEVNTTTGPEFIYTGDRWTSAPDKLKSHDFQYWQPLRWDGAGKIQELKWVDGFVLDLV